MNWARTASSDSASPTAGPKLRHGRTEYGVKLLARGAAMPTSFLSSNVKFLVHLRHRMHDDNRLGLCLGAGVSTYFNIPGWPTLIARIAEHEAIKGTALLEVSESFTAQTQFLYQRYLQSPQAAPLPGEDDVERERRVRIGWLDLVHECLYRDTKTSDEDLKGHPYLWALVPLIKASAMTINYNFDDTVERMLYLFNNEQNGKRDDKGFEVIWSPSSQFRRNRGVLYHPNGFLPLEKIDGFSENIVFMEQEFADQLADIGAGHYSALLSHLAKHTIIFLGLSLSDANLKHLLRVSARQNPGTFHYHIHWCPTKPSIDEQEAIRKANFSTYNLVTLFLDSEEIKQLATILVMPDEEFSALCDAESDGLLTDYRYYLTGPVGGGKTSTLEHIKGLATFDEWVDRRNPLLGRPHGDLSTSERESVDEWINQQFRKKNRRVTSARDQLSLVDRSPLDPLYFVADEGAVASRAAELLRWMVPSKGRITHIAPGHLIILKCNERILKLRLANRGKTYNEEQLKIQSEAILNMWRGHPATIIDTTNMTPSQVVSKVPEAVLFQEYAPIDFDLLCKKIAKAGN
ncbi:SIR2 family protein [Eleftheria terrae]|uniref:SIR2 family protein n=1 Tax=Eleftheria terrae TaxID=1597781 RepID=UPI00263AC2CA|nr:SIR2 family protein [Eleftheria terrae]WKB56041.1 SIR2 family protein [Eleftheria terrae]